ncbi:MAG: hypothetical protein J1E85_06555 [Ruminococcus sp.]|nr:hypothetical protein [Ruminococcus sp.]
MKNEVKFKRVLSLIIVAVIAFFCSATVFAVDLDGDGIDDEEPVYTEAPTEYVEPEPIYTEAPTEYVEPVYTEAPTEYVEPEPVYTEAPTEDAEPVYTEAPTQYVEQAPVAQETTEFQAPTLAKTISDKQYSTNYIAGIISWICVAVGVIVVAAVLISTKLSGKKG